MSTPVHWDPGKMAAAAVVIAVATLLCALPVMIYLGALPGQWLALIPHRHCLGGRRDLLAALVLCNAAIWLAYWSIPWALMRGRIIRERMPIRARRLYWMLAAFIFACGGSHVMDIVVLWWPAYGVQTAILALTAGISVPTAVLLGREVHAWRRLPPPMLIDHMIDLLYERAQNGTATPLELEAYRGCVSTAEDFFRLDDLRRRP